MFEGVKVVKVAEAVEEVMVVSASIVRRTSHQRAKMTCF